MCSGPPKDLKWPAFTGPTSRIIKDPKDWCDGGILIPHETIRWWDKQILEALEVYDPIGKPDTAWKTDVLFNFLEQYYVACIHHHHDAEEKIYNPGIEAKGGKITDKIKTDHEVLIKMLDAIPSYRAKVESAAGVAEFKQHMKTMLTTMEDHLAEEEQDYPRVLRAHLTEADEKALVEQIIQGLGLDGNKKFLPPLMYAMCMWKGEKEAFEWLEANPPPPIRMMFHQCWLSDFNENQLKPLMALKKDEFFSPEAPTCNLCTIM